MNYWIYVGVQLTLDPERSALDAWSYKILPWYIP